MKIALYTCTCRASGARRTIYAPASNDEGNDSHYPMGSRIEPYTRPDLSTDYRHRGYRKFSTDEWRRRSGALIYAYEVEFDSAEAVKEVFPKYTDPKPEPSHFPARVFEILDR